MTRHSYERLSARPCRYGLTGARQLYGLEGVQDVTTHAPLRSQWTKAKSVCHVRGLDDGDSSTSLTKDTRLSRPAIPWLTPYRRSWRGLSQLSAPCRYMTGFIRSIHTIVPLPLRSVYRLRKAPVRFNRSSTRGTRSQTSTPSGSCRVSCEATAAPMVLCATRLKKLRRGFCSSSGCSKST